MLCARGVAVVLANLVCPECLLSVAELGRKRAGSILTTKQNFKNVLMLFGKQCGTFFTQDLLDGTMREDVGFITVVLRVAVYLRWRFEDRSPALHRGLLNMLHVTAARTLKF